MSKKEVSELIATCLQQKINFDIQIQDVDREWWYVSGMYKKDQETSSANPEELVELIKALNLDSIKDIQTYKMGEIDSQMRNFIQIKGDRLEIIKECLTIK